MHSNSVACGSLLGYTCTKKFLASIESNILAKPVYRNDSAYSLTKSDGMLPCDAIVALSIVLSKLLK